MKPTTGRILRYRGKQGFNVGPGDEPGQWSWPPRVGA